jgi:hypothetical protein
MAVGRFLFCNLHISEAHDAHPGSNPGWASFLFHQEQHMEGQEPTNTGQEPNNANGNDQESAPTAVDENTPFEVDKLPVNVQKHIRELRAENARERKQYAAELREATKNAAEGSDLKKALMEASTRADQAEQRAVFFEEASRPEIACTNAKVALAVAVAEGLFTKRGDPDWPAIKAAAPELFGRKSTPPGHAGSGNGSPPAQATMNDYIRAATGRR